MPVRGRPNMNAMPAIPGTQIPNIGNQGQVNLPIPGQTGNFQTVPQPQDPNRLPTQQEAAAQGGAFSSTPASNTQLPTLSPQQQQYQNFLLQQLPGLLQNLQSKLSQPTATSQFDFAPIAQQARTQFKTQTVPTLAERFGALAGDSRGSSGVFGQLGAAGAGLDENLASLQQQYGMQQQAFNYGAQQNQTNQLLQLLSLLSGQGLGRSQENIYDPGQSSGAWQLLNSLVGGLGSAAGKVGGAYLGSGF